MDRRLEEDGREVVGLGLDVLRQRDEGRATGRRIEHHGHRLGQGLDDLLGAGDPIPVAGDGLEGVGDGDRRVVEVLDLLEDGVDDPMLEGVAREEQDRQPVGMGGRGRGHEVGRARSDRRGGDHDPPSSHGLRVGHGRQRHRLLVVTTPGRQPILDGLQRFAEAGHVAVPEDREDAGEERHLVALDHGALRQQPADERLRHGQADGLHRRPPRTRSRCAVMPSFRKTSRPVVK